MVDKVNLRNRIANIFLTYPDDRMYGEVLDVILEAMGSQYGYFGYIDEDGSLVVPSLTKDIWAECKIPNKTIVFPRVVWSGIRKRAILEKKMVLSNEPLKVPKGHISLNRALAAPVIHQDEVIGQITVGQREDDYGQDDCEILESMLEYIAPLLHVRLQEAIHEKAREEAKRALSASETRYRSLVENMTDGLGVRDAEDRITYVNARLCEMLGYTPQKMLGRQVRDFLDDRNRQILEEQTNQRKSDIKEPYEIEWTGKDGKKVCTLVSPQGIFDSDGTYEGSFAIITGIGERKKEEERRKLAGHILKKLNQQSVEKQVIADIIVLVKESLGFDAVGIRLKRDGDFPYFCTEGFSRDFLEQENYLCARDEKANAGKEPLLECMCGNILSGRTDSSLPFFTEGGSFWTNNTTRLMAGFSKAELEEMTIRGVCHKSGYESVALVPLRSGQQIVGLLQLNSRQRDYFTLEVIRFFEELCGSIGIALARIEAERALQESEKRYRSLVEMIPYGVYECNTAGLITITNSSYARITGYTKNELLNMHIWDMMEPGEQKESLPEYLQMLVEEQPVAEPYMARNITKDGRVIDVQVDWVYKYDRQQHLEGFVCVLSDITRSQQERHEREGLLRELALKNKELESIIHVTSHDLRGPLTNIDGFNRDLVQCCRRISALAHSKELPVEIRKEFIDICDQEMPEILGAVRLSTAEINSLLEGLLKLARLGRAAINIGRVDMNSIIDDIIKAHEYIIKESGATIHVDQLPPCQGDAAQIKRVFSNLIDNAVKYLDSSRAGAIGITGREDKGRSIYCVADNGIGIAEYNMDVIFSIFHRVDPAVSNGEGLGLTIVRRILDRNSGKIWVESKLGEGSKFFVSLPAV